MYMCARKHKTVPSSLFCQGPYDSKNPFLARDSIYAKHAVCCLLSIHPSHGWISQKQLKLGL